MFDWNNDKNTEIQEVKEKLKDIFRAVINNEKVNNGWVTLEDKKGEPYHVKIDEEETDKKTDKPKEKKTEDKKETYQDTIDRLDKKYGVDKNDKGESWYDRASESEIKTDIKTLEHEIDKNTKEIERLKSLSDDVASKIYGGRNKKIDGLNEQIKRDKEHIEYAKAHLKKKQAKQPKQLKLLNSIIAEALTEAVIQNCLGE